MIYYCSEPNISSKRASSRYLFYIFLVGTLGLSSGAGDIPILCWEISSSHEYQQCPKIGWFGWEMTPNGEQFSTLTSDFQCEFLTLSWWFGISDCDNTANKAITNWNYHSFLYESNSCHIFIQIFHSHSLFGARIFHSDTQAKLQFWDTEYQTTAITISRMTEKTTEWRAARAAR